MQNESELPQKQMCSASDKQQNSTFALFLHIVLLLPFVGWFITLVMWVKKKDESPLVRQHGAAIMNMFVSTIIYFVAGIILAVILAIIIDKSNNNIGRRVTTEGDDSAAMTFLFLSMLVIAVYFLITLIFIIVNAVRASNGEAASYPLAIRMLNTDLAKEALRVEDHLVD
jgi:uncharacterized Tic20 family protein